MCIFMYVFSNVKWRGGLSPPLEWDFFGVLLSWYLLNLKLPTSLISTDLFSNTFNQGKRTETIPSLENHWRFCASTSCGSIDGDPWEYHDGEPSEPSDGTSYTFGTSTTSVNWNDASWKYPWRILDSFFFLGWGEKKNRVGGWVGVNWTGEKAKLCVYFFFKCISVGLNCFGVLDNGFSRIHFGPLRRTSIDWHLIWTDLHRTWIPFFFQTWVQYLFCWLHNWHVFQLCKYTCTNMVFLKSPCRSSRPFLSSFSKGHLIRAFRCVDLCSTKEGAVTHRRSVAKTQWLGGVGIG